MWNPDGKYDEKVCTHSEFLRTKKSSTKVTLYLIFSRDIEDLKLSRAAITHIFLATKCWTIKDKSRILQLLKEIQHLNCGVEDENTFIGCKSILWSTFQNQTLDKTIYYATQAIKRNPECAVWHFILGKAKRRQRREILKSAIDSTEMEAFEKAHQHSKNELFHFYYAQSFLDSGKKKEAVHQFFQVFYNVKSSGLLLRLAKNFMSCNKLEAAEKCLDKVKPECKLSPMYLHYRAFLHERKAEFQVRTLSN